MTYSEFLLSFVNGLRDVFDWLRYNLFPSQLHDNLPFFSQHLIFTLMALSLLLLMIEEFVGIITSWRFGGLFFRLFRIIRPRGYDVDYKVSEAPDYSKENKYRPYRFFMNPFYRQKYTGKYFMIYQGRYFPVRVPRYNPFAMRRFNAAYNAGHIVSYDKIVNLRYNSEVRPGNVAPVNAGMIRSSMASSFSSNQHHSFNRKLFNSINEPDPDPPLDYLNSEEVEGISDFETENYVGLGSDSDNEAFLHYSASDGVSLEDYLAAHGASLDDIHF